jgi:hypothetical protein
MIAILGYDKEFAGTVGCCHLSDYHYMKNMVIRSRSSAKK